jgi:uncharacterized protein YegP (UPF0339 family)
MTELKVELYRADDGDWYFRFIAANGEQLTRSSEGYQNKADAMHAARLAHGNLVAILTEDDAPDA